MDSFSRRTFLAGGAALIAAAKSKAIPVGLELYSVRGDLKQDPMETVRKVAKMGYECVEFYAPYYDWTTQTATDMRKLMDDLNIKCHSTHNALKNLAPSAIDRGIELNHVLGSTYVVVASAGRPTTLDAWKKTAELIASGAERLRAAKLHAGYHNHHVEFVPIEGKRPIEVLAANTPKDVMLQLDVGTCLEAGADPVDWINQNPGRIRSLHCKDWAPGEGKGYKVLFGEGVAPWKKIFEAAEKRGGVEYFLIEQEGSAYSELETAERCLANFKKLRS